MKGGYNMLNGGLVKMNNGRFTRTFCVFGDGTAKEYTEDGLRDVTCQFLTLYRLLQINGYIEI